MILLNTKHKKHVKLGTSWKDLLECVCVQFLIVPGEKTFGLKRISNMVSLKEPTVLQAARTALVPRESPVKIEIFM